MNTALLHPHIQASVELPLLVSATSLSADGEVRAVVRPCVPNYALRRCVVGTVAVLALGVGLIGLTGLLAGFTGAPASAAAAADVDPAPAAVHVATPGDTLWSIADTHRGDISRDRYIDALVRLNGGTTVRAGQAIWLP